MLINLAGGITCGAAVPKSARADATPQLNVLYFPFSKTIPQCGCRAQELEGARQDVAGGIADMNAVICN